ncbi:class I SAM-dependent methyltransferase [Parasynechococcus marenigrum]|uniref:Conserved hypothetical n=1 Tax=Parasynechococcus marenigrum (strain WH8102) TaxID=84588 RepID=Q7U929_PARMW|nr:class I SAM-dependent methyltransferase [Parasynechococcus marenigrum]CAE06945.1 conserved hypothetical [Parasynechococcus marenigrum WH 8102]
MTFFQRITNKLKRSFGLGVRKTEPWFELAEAALIYKAESYKSYDLKLLKLTGVEIGAHRGNHAARILSRLPISSLCLIDPWSVYSGDEDYFQNQNIQESFYLETCSRFKSDPRVMISRKSSLEAIHDFADSSLDFAYIDGDHSYQAVSQDLNLWWPKVKHRGLLVGDDYKFKFPGVMKAIEEFQALHQVSLYKLDRGQYSFLKIEKDLL